MFTQALIAKERSSINGSLPPIRIMQGVNAPQPPVHAHAEPIFTLKFLIEWIFSKENISEHGDFRKDATCSSVKSSRGS